MKNILTIFLLAFGLNQAFANDSLKQKFKEDYAHLVYLNYQDSLKSAQKMQDEIANFLANPNDENLARAKTAWLEARRPYGQSEAFRFYEGPIDFADVKTGEEGPEGRLNAWPLDEAFIDYVKGNEKAGIVNDESIEITAQNLQKMNQENDEARVSLGYHAIEFLLWGQDFLLEGAGKRPVSDYSNNLENQRRRAYLQIITQKLVDDLQFLVDEWYVKKVYFFSQNYVAKFLKKDDEIVQQEILSALATLSGFELAAERMATALDSGDQEDEHSCFSDNTHNDFVYNQQGIANVFFGKYGEFEGVGVYDLVAAKNLVLAKKIARQIHLTSEAIAQIPHPIDAKVLAAGKKSVGAQKMEKAVKMLQEQARFFIEAGKLLGLDVKIASE